MTTKNFKIALFSAIAVAALIASPLVMQTQAEAQTEKITRHVTEEEFREAQERVLDLRAEKTRLENLSSTQGVDTSDEQNTIDSEIAKLIPILDKHQEQNFAKHYIAPERKAMMDSIVVDLRNKIGDIYTSNSDSGSYIVNLDTLTKEIKVSTNNPAYNVQIESIISQYPADIPVVFGNHEKIEIIDFDCVNQTDDCDPIVGGIEVEGGCTLGLPVKKGTWPSQTDGYVTAGHCIGDNQELNQPNAGSPVIGDNTDSRNEPDCDCAFVDENTSTTTHSWIWRSSDNYLAVSTEATSRPAPGYDIVVSGVAGGFMFGEILTSNLSWTDGSVTYDWLEHDITMTNKGDSGAPIGDADASQIEGIIKGKVTIDGGPLDGDHYIGSAWEELDSDFNLSLQ